jgi:RNase P/RNase MRP subunit POP5
MISILLNFSNLVLVPIVVAAVLLMIFPEIRPIKRYLPAVALAFALPTVSDSLRSTISQNMDFTFGDTVFAMAYYILTGLGFGAVAGIISRERRKALWLLFAGPPGYFLTVWVSNVLMARSYHEYTIVLWSGIASLAMHNLLIGMVMGLLLGVVLEFIRRDTSPPHLSST